jgi:hypothetical protein
MCFESMSSTTSKSPLQSLSFGYPPVGLRTEFEDRSSFYRTSYEVFFSRNLCWIAFFPHLVIIAIHVAIVIILPLHWEHNIKFAQEKQKLVSTVLTISLQTLAIVSANFDTA